MAKACHLTHYTQRAFGSRNITLHCNVWFISYTNMLPMQTHRCI